MDVTTIGPLRILMFSSFFPNAAEPFCGTFVRDRARAMARFAEVEVMAPVPWWPWPWAPGISARYYQSVPRLDAFQGMTVHHPRFLALPRLLEIAEPLTLALSCALAILTVRRRFRFDFLSVQGVWPDGVVGAALARLAGVRFSVTVGARDTTILAQEPGRRTLMRWALRRAALVIAASPEIHDRVLALGVPDSRVAVIPNGVDVDRFRPLDREAARACLGIPSSARVVLSVGRLHPSRRFPDLVDALVKLARADPDLRLVIVGDPDPRADATPDIRAAITRSGLQGRVLIRRRSPEEMVWWYSAADLLCLPAEYTGSGNVAFEAMACGLPCIMAAEGTLHPAASDGPSLTHAIDVALRSQWDRNEVARQAQSRRWDVIARECCERLAAVGRLQEAAA